SCAEGERVAETLERRRSLHDRNGPVGVDDRSFDGTLCNQHAGAADPRLRLDPEGRFLETGNELVDDFPRFFPITSEHVIVRDLGREPARRLLVTDLLGNLESLLMQLG